MRVALVMLGMVLVASGGALLWTMHAYRQSSRSSAAQLVHGEQIRASRAADSDTGCYAPSPSDPRAGTVRAVLSIPVIGIEAPILAGTEDAQLDHGVGHLTSSAWPGQGGVVVLEAHDVTFFTSLDKLPIGAMVYVTAPCRRWVYRVESAGIVRKGAAIRSSGPSLVLVTCWPTNALYFTSHRYVVTANIVSASSEAASAIQAVAEIPPARAALPAALVSQDLSLDRVHLPVGTLTEESSIVARLRLSTSAYADVGAVETMFVAALVTADQEQHGWWSVLAPAVPYRDLGPLRGSLPVRWQSPVNLTLQGSGMTVTGATASGTAWLVEAGTTRLCRIDMTASVTDDQFYIVGWSVEPLNDH